MENYECDGNSFSCVWHATRQVLNSYFVVVICRAYTHIQQGMGIASLVWPSAAINLCTSFFVLFSQRNEEPNMEYETQNNKRREQLRKTEIFCEKMIFPLIYDRNDFASPSAGMAHSRSCCFLLLRVLVCGCNSRPIFYQICMKYEGGCIRCKQQLVTRFVDAMAVCTLCSVYTVQCTVHVALCQPIKRHATQTITWIS